MLPTQSTTYANGVVESYQYNKANWITSLVNSKNGTTLSSYAYTYYASGSQKSETDNTGVVTSYVYDGLGRLTKESETGGLTLAYSYDANGNRTQMVVSGTESYTTAYTYDANNRLTTEAKTQDGTTTTTTYTYDDNGNLLSELDAANAVVVTHAYDNFNRLTTTNVGSTKITYAYNARGIRTARYVGDTLTQYLLDGGNVAGEVVDGTLSAAYIRGINLILRQAPSVSVYYLYNAHGDVVQLTDATGTVTKTYDYDAFGNEENPSASDINPFRYCGEYFDTETGLYYLRARYYDPTVGRFTQEDTHWNTANMIYGDNPQKINEREDALGLKTYSYVPQISAVMQSGNLYVYCVNNPVVYADSTGEVLGVVGWIVLGAAIGGVLGGAMDIASQLVAGAEIDSLDWSSVAISAGAGAVSGAFGASPMGLGGQIVVNALLGGTESVLKDVVHDNNIDWFAAAASTGIGAFAGGLGGPGLQKATSVSYYRMVSAGGEFGLYKLTFRSSRVAQTLAKEFIKGTVMSVGADVLIEVIDNVVYIKTLK